VDEGPFLGRASGEGFIDSWRRTKKEKQANVAERVDKEGPSGDEKLIKRPGAKWALAAAAAAKIEEVVGMATLQRYDGKK